MADTAQVQKQIEAGYVVEEEVDGVKRYKNRTLKELLEWRLSTKKATKKAVLAELADRLKKPCGAREKARLEGLVKHFTAIKVKEVASDASHQDG